MFFYISWYVWHACQYYDVCFFFNQKTAYEMRISDWSSDVCSSDLDADILSNEKHSELHGGIFGVKARDDLALGFWNIKWQAMRLRYPRDEKDHKSDRKSVVSGKSVSERVDLGGSGIIQKRKSETKRNITEKQKPVVRSELTD